MVLFLKDINNKIGQGIGRIWLFRKKTFSQPGDYFLYLSLLFYTKYQKIKTFSDRFQIILMPAAACCLIAHFLNIAKDRSL